ncbi:adenosylcobinamide-phosphate synthase CbiB [Carnimonas bestiolae]|uniref:adenosylcobinamide-phosphate synthase CbiB n=1 Tax=Carnimonas bestiolae TaxID=3402172 RepID=UPI003EDC678A
MMSMAVPLLLGCLLDWWWGEPRRFHPLVGWARWAQRLEQALHGQRFGILRGGVAWALAVLPAVAVAAALQLWLGHSYWMWLPAALGVYLSIGWESLTEHGQRVATPLLAGNIHSAREALGMIVSRDVDALDEQGIANAACESMLENGADAVFAALFWFALLGLPGVMLYRLSNTLDAMWGYKNERYLTFGRVAARADDILNWLPARLTVLAYAAVSGSIASGRASLRCARTYGARWKSPNAGPVMAAGAGALGCQLGGWSSYHGVRQWRGQLGEGAVAAPADIIRAIALVNRAGVLWVAVTLAVIAIISVFS